MTGPNHYRVAERLLTLANEATDQPAAKLLVAGAQVHATLALVAATAEQIASRGPGDLDVMWNPIFRGDQ